MVSEAAVGGSPESFYEGVPLGSPMIVASVHYGGSRERPVPERPCVTAALKEALLLLCQLLGGPDLGVISETNTFTTFCVFSFLQGKASVQFVKASTQMNKA